MGIWESQAGGSSSGVELGETSTTAYRGDRGKTAYDHSQISHIDYHGIQSAGTISATRSGAGTVPSPYAYSIAVSEINYWYQGVQYISATPVSIDLATALGTAVLPNKLYYVYFSNGTGTLTAGTSMNLKTLVPLCMVYTNADISALTITKETHNHTRNLDWHINAHRTIGTRYYNGLALTAPTTADDDTLNLSTGIIYDEDIAITITNPSTSRVWYQVSNGVYTWVNSALPYVGSVNDPTWLDTDDYTLKSVADNNYVCEWVYATNDIDRPIYIIPTQASTAHSTITVARNELQPVLSGLLQDLAPEWKLIYRFIYKGDGEFQEATDYRNVSSLPAGATAPTSAAAVTFTASGNIAATNVQTALEEIDTEKVSATGSDGQLSRQMLIDCGMTFLDKGNSGTTTQTLDYTAGSHQKITATGNFTIALSNFPPTGNLGELLLELVNGGAYTITLPTVNWIKPDGSTTTTWADYLTANTGRTALQTSGTDFILLFSRDGGTTVYGRLI